MVRAELRTATDAAARAGAEALGRLESESAAIDAAVAIAAENIVFGHPLLLAPEDVVIGRNLPQSDGSFAFSPGGSPANAVRVTGRRQNGSPSGPVPLMFAPLFGVNQVEPVQVATAGRLDRDIALVLDVSGSMADEGRFPALQNALSVFLDELGATNQDEYVSLTKYSNTATKLQELTPNLALVESAFQSESPGGMTAIGLGLQSGLDSVLYDPAHRQLVTRSVIVMTDGNHNTGISPLDVAPQAVAANVVVHTITFSTGANQTMMQQLATMTGGIHLHADTNQQLIDAFREIALAVPVTLTE
jgi:Mg-chelatase subunit ChlD